MYVEIRLVVGNRQTDVAVGRPPRAPGVGALETTTQCEGAVTVKVNVDLRSGCSNVVNTRRASGTSNWL